MYRMHVHGVCKDANTSMFHAYTCGTYALAVLPVVATTVDVSCRLASDLLRLSTLGRYDASACAAPALIEAAEAAMALYCCDGRPCAAWSMTVLIGAAASMADIRLYRLTTRTWQTRGWAWV